MENEGRLVSEVIRTVGGEFLLPDELLVDAIVVITVLGEDGEQYLRLKATPMPWWTLNGMLEAAKITEDES
jgi:hypothetical protein